MLTQEQQLQLPAGILLVSPQLLLDLLVDPLVLSVLRRHTAAGHGWTSPPAAPPAPAVSATQPHLVPGSESTEGGRHSQKLLSKIFSLETKTPSAKGNGRK